MAQQDRETLKGYFLTNAYPTEENFADLIDSFATPSELTTAVGFSGDYTDLANTPDFGSAAFAETSDFVVSDISVANGGTTIANIVQLTQAEYDAIGTKDADTLYVITD